MLLADFGAGDRVPERDAIQFFSEIHQRQERVEDTRLEFVWKESACGRTSQQFAPAPTAVMDFHLPFASCAVSRRICARQRRSMSIVKCRM